MSAPNRLARLPPYISRWLGYRSGPAPQTGRLHRLYLWSFIGAFAGISVIQAVFEQAHYFVERNVAVPSLPATYVAAPLLYVARETRNLLRIQGASAVLIYGAVDAPLAQPRMLVWGHFIGALIGVCITKLFHLLPTEERFQSLVWLAGSLSCALSVVAMQITGTTHPPAGELCRRA